MRAVVDFSGRDGPRRLVFDTALQVWTATTLPEVAGVIRAADHAARAGRYVVGLISYEAAPAFDTALPTRAPGDLPLATFAAFEAPTTDPHVPGSYRIDGWTSEVDEPGHAAAVATIQDAIAEGTTYQTNYTLRMRGSVHGDDRAFYDDLCRAQRAGYCAYLDLGRHRVLSASPELFFAWDGHTLTTRPMKGTTARGRFPGEDAAARARLLSSVKDRAENVMIVDLLRNDVARVSVPGSVDVPALFTAEAYPTVWQLTSTVTGRTRPGTGLLDVLTALFPCGSVTGAPKAATMAVIADVETAPRGVYCGAIGLLEPGGAATFSVPIRTVVLDTGSGTAEYGVGGGVTWDSTATAEHAEILAKAAVLTTRRPAFELLETLRLDPSGYPLLAGHLARLTASAGYFAIPMHLDQVRNALTAMADEAHTEDPDACWRVRLLIAEDGGVRTERAALGPPVTGWRGRLATGPVDERSVWLFHKTTNRAVYERHRGAHPDVDDVLLWNTAGELTEWTIGTLVLDLDGRLLTPPVACGLLAGVRRSVELAAGKITEQVLTRDDLTRARRIWLLNALRGWVPMTMVE